MSELDNKKAVAGLAKEAGMLDEFTRMASIFGKLSGATITMHDGRTASYSQSKVDSEKPNPRLTNRNEMNE